MRLTPAGREDALVRAAGLPEEFLALVGHKEAVRELPAHAVNLGVVLTFLLLFFANLILTAVYLQVVPAKGS